MSVRSAEKPTLAEAPEHLYKMSRLVQKFGGTSVADVERIFKAAEIACQAHSQGYDVVNVVGHGANYRPAHCPG